MRAQREKVQLLKDGDADPDDVMLARAKYQGQLNEYSRFKMCIRDSTRTTASRWMEINRRFSEGGYSPYLVEEYKGYNKSQLQEMLYLPEEKLEEVDPGMTAMEIRGSRKEPEEKTQVSAETHREECEEEDEIPGQMRVEAVSYTHLDVYKRQA